MFHEGFSFLGPETDDPEIFKKVKRHFRSCMDDVKQEELGAKPLTDILQNLGNDIRLFRRFAWCRAVVNKGSQRKKNALHRE